MFYPKPFWIQKKWWQFWAWIQDRLTTRYLRGKTCESCGAPATVLLPDMSVWCRPCDNAAEQLGYNDEEE